MEVTKQKEIPNCKLFCRIISGEKKLIEIKNEFIKFGEARFEEKEGLQFMFVVYKKLEDAIRARNDIPKHIEGCNILVEFSKV